MSAAVQDYTRRYIRSGGCPYSLADHRISVVVVCYSPEERRFREREDVVQRILHRYSHMGHQRWMRPASRSRSWARRWCFLRPCVFA
jgi:hypothetical protein